jgi:quercetin dioxygenase-like cupin family protein
MDNTVLPLEVGERHHLLFADLAKEGDVTVYGLDGFEMAVVNYADGTEIPLHGHSAMTLKVVLAGALDLVFEDGVEVTIEPGEIYVCPSRPAYRGVCRGELKMLVFQPPGSRRELVAN